MLYYTFLSEERTREVVMYMRVTSCSWHACCMRYTTHPYAWRDSFICVAWLIHVWHDSSICVAGLNSYVSHDSFICVARLIHTGGRTLSYFTWLIHMCHATHPCWAFAEYRLFYRVLLQKRPIIHMTHPYVWYACPTWMRPRYVWSHDSSICVSVTYGWVMWNMKESWCVHECDASRACALSIQGQTRWESKYTKEVMLMAWLWVALHGSSIRVKGLIRVCDMTTSWLIHMFERRLWSHVIYDDQKIKRHVRFFLYGSLEEFCRRQKK